MINTMTIDTRPVVVVGGGQSGLAAARALAQAGVHPLVLEASPRTAGSWPDYYHSLTLFSPAQYSSMPGMPFPGQPDHYPRRDEVARYLERYAASLDVEFRTGVRVTAVEPAEGRGYLVRTGETDGIEAAAVVAASGSFGNPFLPVLPGQDTFGGTVRHVASYRTPEAYAGQRIVVVGGGNSAVQIAHELTQVAQVTLASRRPVRCIPQLRDGRDLHYWLDVTGFDRLPPAWLAQFVTQTLVLDTGGYAEALVNERLPWWPMFTGFTPDGVYWADGSREPVDVLLLATGYRPDLGYLRPLGALYADGSPQHHGGVSTSHPGLAYVGLEFQRSFASNTLRGVWRDAEHVAAPIAAYVRGAAALIGA